ncbi:right-handed parallel beta-helix repeat-containing protein [Massilia timonae]|uniref:Right handed beta helix region family protein n=1 Tax=Massilia timonae TaxID=47229 RepID=A0A1S2NAD9_9BURK|nr:right-handed parallel beta-helix repeat-containing protein [Massilia timonae]OIJ41803.1 right handed beta helix region family protein [Massilia timonae]
MNYLEAFMKSTASTGAAACLLLAAQLGTAHAATITVSPGQSIQTAVNGAVAGDTVRVLAGTYTQKVLVANKSGTASAPITIKADPGVVLKGGSGVTPSGRQGLITIRNANHVRVEGFEVTGFTSGSSSATPVGILIEGSGAGLQIVDNKIHGIKHTSTCRDPCAVGAHGLAVFGTTSAGITDLLVQGNEVYQNVLQASEALVINGNVDRFEVLNNHVHDNNNIGFDFIGFEGECSGCGDKDRARNGIVRNNRAVNNSSSTNPWYGGEGSAAGFYVDGGRYIVFDGNTSTGNDLGFEFASEHAGKATEDIVMSNNVVYKNREVGLTVGGYDAGLGAARRIHVHNNSFYKNQGWGTEIVFQHKVIDSRFSNNIFFGTGPAADNYLNEGSGHSGNVWGTNLWWGTNASGGSLPGVRVLADPRFIAPESGNLNLQATSPAIGVGATGAALTTWTSPLWSRYFAGGAIPVNGVTDINGQARIEGTIDLGADEYGSAPAANK